MRKLLFTLITLAIFASCSPLERLARLYAKHSDELPERKDTVLVPGETVYRDTTVYKYLPPEIQVESLYIDVPISIPDTFLEARTSAARALAFLQDNELGLQLIQYDTVIQWKLDSVIRYHTDTVVVTNEKVVVEEKEIPPKPFWRIGFMIMAGLMLLTLFLLVRK